MKYFLNFLLLLLIVFFVFSCSSEAYRLSDDEKIVNQITQETAEKLHKKKGLVLIGTGGQMMNDIQMMSMSFNYYHPVDLETARELIVSSVKEYLFAINNNREVRPYLHSYPFTAENVEVVIFFRNPDGSNISSDEINIAAANRGEVIFYVDYPDKHTIKAIYQETYEEALTQSILPGK